MLAICNNKAVKTNNVIDPTGLPRTKSEICIIFLLLNLFSNKYSIMNPTIAVSMDIIFIYHPAVPTILTNMAGLVKNTFITIVITIRLIASW